jgi:hypothetical protein
VLAIISQDVLDAGLRPLSDDERAGPVLDLEQAVAHVRMRIGAELV